MKSVAILVGADRESPGGRGPIFSDGSFEFVPRPESDAFVAEPTYADLGLEASRPAPARDRVVHFDPEFPELEYGERYTFGARHAPETTAIARLDAGDILFFYATLEYVEVGPPDYPWINEGWGAYLIGHFTLADDPIAPRSFAELSTELKVAFRNNAHARRREFDAEILVLGNPAESALYERAIPLSGSHGSEPNTVITAHSDDSGSGPWYRRPIPFDDTATRWILDRHRQTVYEIV